MRDLKIVRLSDEFGQYELWLTCKCGHTRRCNPRTLASIAGWEAELAAIVRRLRCIKCGQRNCTARALPPTPPRGYKSH